MFFFGVILVLLGGISIWIAISDKADAGSLAAASTVPIGQLVAQHAAAVQAGMAGRFRQVSEVVGWSTPNPQGMLTADMSKQQCVWFRSTVDVRYEETRTQHPYGRHTTTRSLSSADSSKFPFGLRDETGVVFVSPTSTPEGAVQVVDRFEPHYPDHPMLAGFARGALASLARARYEVRFLGYEYREFILPPDVRFFAHGEVADSTGQLMFGSGTDEVILSTGSKEAVQREKESDQRVFGWVGAALVLIGLALCAAYVVTHHH